MHWSRDWSCTDHVTDHAQITWLIMHWSRGYHSLLRWLIMQWSRSYHVLVTWLITTSVVSDSVRPRRRQPIRLLCPWDSLGKSAGVGCHFLLHSNCEAPLSVYFVLLLLQTASYFLLMLIPEASLRNIRMISQEPERWNPLSGTISWFSKTSSFKLFVHKSFSQEQDIRNS